MSVKKTCVTFLYPSEVNQQLISLNDIDKFDIINWRRDTREQEKWLRFCEEHERVLYLSPRKQT